jgi:hypothetical protein
VKTEQQVRTELVRVREVLKRARDEDGEEEAVLYGAQQALGWVLGELRAPSQLEAILVRLSYMTREQEKTNAGYPVRRRAP